ncbi:MAG: alpha/beta hydrolase [Bdellovibrio sp.]
MRKSELALRLKSHNQRIMLKNCEVSFNSFTGPFVAHKTPVIVLCDSLLRPEIYFELVEKTLKDRPLYVVDTCSFKIQSEPHLDTQQMTEILIEWLDTMGIDRVILMGMGLSFPLAQRFAQIQPTRCDRLIVAGVTGAVRDSVKLLINEQIEKLEKGNTRSFAKGLSYIFSNFNFKDKIDRAESYRMVFEQYIRKLNSKMLAHLKSDLKRFLDCANLYGTIECQTLIIQAEYDSVCTINEGLQFAKRCLRSQLAILECLDHLAPVQNMKVLTRLLRRFLADESLGRMTGVELYTKKSLPVHRMQMTPRYQFEQFGFLDSGNGVLIPVQIMDINRNGCRLYTTFTDHKDLRNCHHFTLSIPDRELEIEMILFSQDGNGNIRAVFVHDDNERFQKVNDAIELIAMEFDEAPIVA